jgi:hypothetical protein
MTYNGANRGLIEAIPTFPVLERLIWNMPTESVLDLRQTHLTDLSVIGIDRSLEIWLPQSCACLTLGGRYDRVTIHARDIGEGFKLCLRGPFAGLPHGLEAVEEVVFFDGGRIDIAALGAWPKLKDLSIYGSANSVDNIAALNQLKSLRRFAGAEIYAIAAQEFPVDCALHEVSIDGLRAADAKLLRQRLKHLPRAVFSKARSEKWLAENLDNPFRDWDADGLAFGKAAIKLWKQAIHATHTLDGASTPAQAKTIVLALVAGMNKLSKRYEIDTLRREQACHAIRDLVSTHLGGILNAEETQQVIDEARDW